MNDDEIPDLIDANESGNLNHARVKPDQSVKKVPITIVTGKDSFYVRIHLP